MNTIKEGQDVSSNCCNFSIPVEDQQDMVEMFKAVGNPIRFKIIKFLIENPGCITADLVDSLPVAQATTSQHLQVLKQAGWIVTETKGPATCYYLNAPQINKFSQVLKEMFML